MNFTDEEKYKQKINTLLPRNTSLLRPLRVLNFIPMSRYWNHQFNPGSKSTQSNTKFMLLNSMLINGCGSDWCYNWKHSPGKPKSFKDCKCKKYVYIKIREQTMSFLVDQESLSFFFFFSFKETFLVIVII